MCTNHKDWCDVWQSTSQAENMTMYWSVLSVSGN